MTGRIALKWLIPSRRNDFLREFSQFKEFSDTFTTEEWIQTDQILAELRRQSEISPLSENSMKQAAQNLDLNYGKALNLMHRLPKGIFRRYSLEIVPQLTEENKQKRIDFATRCLNGEINIEKLIITDECSGN